jgi:NAD(P)-dependent dehydrogenase (short-subunit alcohol dehydrogenase family)
VTARTQEEIDKVASEINAAGGKAFAIACDVTDPKSTGEMACKAAGELGSIDILVNNAGMAGSAPLHKETLEQWNRFLAVNATSAFLCSKNVLAPMLERKWGRIINIASVAGLAGAKYVSSYCASKHAMVGFTKAVGMELYGTGVTINAICPGYVDTAMARKAVETAIKVKGFSEEEALQAVLGTSGQTKLIDPNEIAQKVVDLCADNSDINGQAIVIADGGKTE